MTDTTTETRERPIPFTVPMVQAVEAQRKTQTRRVMVPQPVYNSVVDRWVWPRSKTHQITLDHDAPYQPEVLAFCPYGKVGDHLWVRETWATVKTLDHLAPSQIWQHDRPPALYYAAWTGAARESPSRGKWRPPMFMPHWASRIDLENVSIRVERVQDISEADVLAEGVGPYRLAWWDGFVRLGDQRVHTQRMVSPDSPGDAPDDLEHAEFQTYEQPAREQFKALWNQINGPRGYGWDSNPWVWAIEFKQLPIGNSPPPPQREPRIS